MKLMPKQKEALKKTLQHKKLGLFMAPGTGKTIVSVKNIMIRHKLGLVNRVAIFTPLDMIEDWGEALATWSGGVRYSVLKLGVGYSRVEARKSIKNFFAHEGEGLQILLINYEKSIDDKLDLRKYSLGMIILDESQTVKNRNSKTHRKLYQLSRVVDYKLLLTGTPMGSQGVEDLFGQYRIMDSSILGTWSQFKEDYLVMGGYMGKQVVGSKNTTQLRKIVEATSIRVSLREVVDLPPLVEEYIPITLSSEGRQKYEEIDKHMLTEIDRTLTLKEIKEGLTSQGVPFSNDDNRNYLFLLAKQFLNITTCDLAVTKIVRLHQICGGFLTLDSGDLVRVDHTKSSKVIEYLNSEVDGRALIFCNYVAELEALKDEIMSKTNKKVALYRGRKQKKNTYEAFKRGEIDVMILQSRSGVGLNLQLANYLIFYSMSYSYEKYTQTIPRIERIGQKKPMKVVYFLAQDTIDEDIIRAHKRSHELVETIIPSKSGYQVKRKIFENF